MQIPKLLLSPTKQTCYKPTLRWGKSEMTTARKVNAQDTLGAPLTPENQPLGQGNAGMLNNAVKRVEPSFRVSLLPAVVLGTAVCCLFYFLILLPPLRHPMVIRYALCHWVAVASAWLFCTASIVLLQKLLSVRKQWHLATLTESSLDSLVQQREAWESSATMDAYRRAIAVQDLWKLQPAKVQKSWYGQRIANVIERQVERRSIQRLDEDLQANADRDADAQHASLAMVRINCWAMPMLGFLGTVIGISDTLGQMDAQALASGSQDAMNNLTSGLYVAFDTTAVGLVLTMIAMFMQFVVQRAEDSLLNTIDQGTASYLHRCLSEQDHSDTSDVEASLKLIAHRLMDSMQLIVERQADLWKSKLDEAHSQWNALAENSQHIAIETITRALTDAMAVHRAAMQEDLNHLVLLQSEGAMQIDQRLQQWQTTISEQARVTLRQQQELNRNAELLEKLLESSQLVQAMQQPLQATLERLTDVDRFEEAAISLSEAVMVLTSQLQRSGQLGRQTVRRRTATTDPNAFSTEITEQENLQPTPGSSLETGASSTAATSTADPQILPFQPLAVTTPAPSDSRDERRAG